VRIPRKSMPELANRKRIVGNFRRRRELKDKKGITVSYSWHSSTRNVAENCGYIQLEKTETRQNMIKCPDFDGAIHGKRFMGGSGCWGNDTYIHTDNEYFVTKGVSLLLEGECNRIRQNIAVEPNRKYKLSFFYRTEDLSPGLCPLIRLGVNGGTFYVLGTYLDFIKGTQPWTRYEYILTVPARIAEKHPPHLEFSIRKSTGKCWIDHVELLELKDKM